MDHFANAVVTEDVPSDYKYIYETQRDDAVVDKTESSSTDSNYARLLDSASRNAGHGDVSNFSLSPHAIPDAVTFLERRLNPLAPSIGSILRYLISVVMAYTRNSDQLTFNGAMDTANSMYSGLVQYLSHWPLVWQRKLVRKWFENVENFYNAVVAEESRIYVTRARNMGHFERKNWYVRLALFMTSQFQTDASSPYGLGECNLSDGDIHFCSEPACLCNQ